MKKLFLLLGLVGCGFTNFGQTTHFEQDFIASTTVANYTAATAPSIGQFTELSTNTGVTTSINNGRLEFARTSGTNSVRLTRSVSFSPTPGSLYCQFSFGVTSSATQATAATFNIGGSNLADGATTVSDVYAKISVNLTSSSGFTLQSGASTSSAFTGNKNITWVMNNTGSTFTYVAPDGSSETLGNDQFDLWVDASKVFNDLAVQTPSQTISRFKFNYDLGIATLSFDNFLMRDVAGSLAVNTAGMATPDSMLVKYIGAGKNVGLGTGSPLNRLEISASQNDKSGLRFTKLNSGTSTSTWNGKALSVDSNGDVIIVKDSLGAAGTSGWQITAGRIQNTNSGPVVIGALNTSNLPGNYKLYVKDGIMAEEVKIAVQGTSDWSDYVFANDYKLKHLFEVEKFIKANKHLPNVPSAEDVVRNGVNVVKMEAKLLEKIEELTLYMIEMKKENIELKKRLKKLEKRK